MPCEKVIDRIQRGRIIAILRGDFFGQEEKIVAVIHEAGITAVEVTLNSRRALESIQRLAKEFSAAMAVGAGTVLQPEEVDRVADAGAQFVVSPNCNLRVIAATKRRGLASFPGCFTPTEIVIAFDAGADAAKLFPADCLGPNFVKALRGPLPNLRIIPTGGISPESTKAHLSAGAWAVGAGSELIGKNMTTAVGLEKLRGRAQAFVAAAQESQTTGASG